MQIKMRIKVGTNRVFRGGCWYNFGQNCYSAFQFYLTPTHWVNFLGPRVIRRKRLCKAK